MSSCYLTGLELPSVKFGWQGQDHPEPGCESQGALHCTTGRTPVRGLRLEGEGGGETRAPKGSPVRGEVTGLKIVVGGGVTKAGEEEAGGEGEDRGTVFQILIVVVIQSRECLPPPSVPTSS